MLIGLSLSYCISDIINGNVDKNDVAFIICGTRIVSEKDLNDVLDTYAKYDWYANPELGKQIAGDFYIRGKLLQPRVYGFNPPAVNEGIWAKVYGREVEGG